MSKIIAILAASGLATGLALAQPGNDRQSNPAASETIPMPSLANPKEAPVAVRTIPVQAAHQIRTKELIGAKVVHQDHDVGTVDDLLVEEKDAKVVGVVLSVGGVLGVGDKRVAVPWEHIDLIKGAGPKPILYLAMSKEQLEAAPDFEPSKRD